MGIMPNFKGVIGLRKLIVLVMLFAMLCCLSANASADITVYINNELIPLSSDPVIMNDRVMVPIREIAEKMDCVVTWYDAIKTTEIHNRVLTVSLALNDNVISVHNTITNYVEDITMDCAPVLYRERTYLPLRQIIEVLGGTISWDDASKVINITYKSTGKNQIQNIYNNFTGASYPSYGTPQYNAPVTAPVVPQISAPVTAPYQENYYSYIPFYPAVETDSSFYFQNEAKWQFPNFGSGYCWTCSYAMLVSNVTGLQITPVDVAKVNESAGGSGAYCNHWQIINQFNVKFTPALDSSSAYYGGYDSSRGATKINNPTADDNVVRMAIKEALELNPAGVMVRYEIYPHTMVAVKYENGIVYFNDPMRTDYTYQEYSDKQGVPFNQTCLRSYKLSDIEFMQALKAN